MAGTLDQSQTGHASLGGYTYGTHKEAQTFTAGITGNLDTVKLWLYKSGTPANLIVEIRNTSGGVPGSTVYASQEITPASITTNTEKQIDFSSPTSITSGTVYAIVIYQKSDGGNISNAYAFYQNNSGGYAGGDKYYMDGGGWTHQTNIDVYFLTYVTIPPVQKPILSDAIIKIVGIQQPITSDAVIITSIQQPILSDAHIKAVDVQENILSDAKIVIRNPQPITSDATIKITGIQKEITSDAKILEELLYNINNKFNSIMGVIKPVTNYFNSVKQNLTTVGNYFISCKSNILNIANDIRTQKAKRNIILNDIRFLKSWQVAAGTGIQSLGKTEIYVLINGTPQTDVDVDSIRINKSPGTEHTASFELARAYDNTKPAMKSTVTIKYKDYILYTGYITTINPTDETEHISIECRDEFWNADQSNVYFKVGNSPKDTTDKYYGKINEAIISELDWNLGIGNFIPENIDCFAVGKSETLTNLISQCGNHSWYYDVNGNKQLWSGGSGAVVNIQRQQLGTNIGLYQLISHQFSEDISGIVNKFRVQMGEKVIRKSDSSVKNESYSAAFYSFYEQWTYPAWDRHYECLAKDNIYEERSNDRGHGWDYHKPEDDYLYKDVFKRFNLPYLHPGTSSWSDMYSPIVYIFSNPWSNFNIEKILTEGFTIDYENRCIIFNDPQLMYIKDENGDITEIASLSIKLKMWKRTYISVTADPEENPEEDISNPLMFFIGSGPVMKDLNLTNLSIQIGGKTITFISRIPGVEEDDYRISEWKRQGRPVIGGTPAINTIIPSWDDTAFATDIATWKLSQVSNSKITGTIEITLDALCFYGINLSNRIYIDGITDSPMNITSIEYDINKFTVRIGLQNTNAYTRTVSLQSRGE